MVTTLTIAGAHFALASAPVDLDARLIDATGCGVNELEQLLASGPDRVASALEPFLAEPFEHVALSNLIAIDPMAIGLVRALYAALPIHTTVATEALAQTSQTPEAE